jgi:hypothetical protein
MNERLKELAEQCSRHQSYWMEIEGKMVQISEHAEVFDKEKFAELIVQECADWVRENYDHEHAEGIAWNMEIDYGLHGDYA